jgi:hypothetical protein
VVDYVSPPAMRPSAPAGLGALAGGTAARVTGEVQLQLLATMRKPKPRWPFEVAGGTSRDPTTARARLRRYTDEVPLLRQRRRCLRGHLPEAGKDFAPGGCLELDLGEVQPEAARSAHPRVVLADNEDLVVLWYQRAVGMTGGDSIPPSSASATSATAGSPARRCSTSTPPTSSGSPPLETSRWTGENPVPKRRRWSQADVLNVGQCRRQAPTGRAQKRIGRQERATNPNVGARRIRSLAEHAVIGGTGRAGGARHQRRRPGCCHQRLPGY